MESNEIIVNNQNLPTTIDDLAKFVLIGREKLSAVRAEIRAIDKVGLAEEVRQQKLSEAQDIADAVLDAEVRIGELMAQVPKATAHNNPSGLKKPQPQIDSGVDLGSDDDDDPFAIFDQPTEKKTEKKPKPKEKQKTKKEAIEELGLNQKQVERFETLAKHPELVERAKAEARESDTIVTRNDVLKKVKETEKKQKQEEAIQEQIERPKASTHVDIFSTNNKYRVIYADPPWSYNDKQNTGTLGGAEKHYPTMPLDDICKLPVPAEENAVLFLWVTSPLLEDCFKVINAWGFTYKSSFVWDKVKHNMGHYNSVRHEFLLVCTKGSCTPDVQKLYDSVQSIERTDHSRKPKEFRDIIDTLYPAGNRLEMFAREAPEGWDVWGNMV